MVRNILAKRNVIAPSLAMTAALLLMGGSPPPGETAPELTPDHWLNHDGPVSWERLRGQVLLIEKWATW